MATRKCDVQVEVDAILPSRLYVWVDATVEQLRALEGVDRAWPTVLDSKHYFTAVVDERYDVQSVIEDIKALVPLATA